MGRKSSAPAQKKKPHAHWEKVVLAAYLRMMGGTQEEAATGVGRSERTIQLWEADAELWAAAREEARSRWLSEVVDASRLAVLNTIKAGNAELGMRVLERTEPALAPPKQKHEHSGEGGGPIAIEVYGAAPPPPVESGD